MLKTVGFPSTRTGDQTINDGNLIIGTAGKGIDFSAAAHAAGMTSELLNDYEEGTWTPTQGASLAVTGSFSSTGRYTKVGRLVTVSGTLAGSTSIASTAASIMTGSLPFSSAAVSGGTASNATLGAGSVIFVSATNIFCTQVIALTTIIYFSATYSV
jgi:hypothetical protein